VGLVNRSFDVLDTAAIAFLQQARQQCDRLIVSTDAKPLLLASMVYVDLVITGSPTTGLLIEELRPDYSEV
jgi:bifunctional ADP-heptose synthase (sugar kinase/adenylyltransferase)